jgi:preprotein translocase subunit SecB
MSEAQQPAFGIQKIYLKDMSLEIPNAPQVFLERENPQVDVNIHNEARPLGQPGLFEVILTVKTVFLVEAAQAGIFEIINVPPAETEAVLGIVCPSTLLPYAREAIASTVTRAGFPPVVLQHMSFEAIYQQQQAQLQQQAQQSDAPPAH